jgi:hypothetical protein
MIWRIFYIGVDIFGKTFLCDVFCEDTYYVVTGGHTGQEVYLYIKVEIEGKLPNYDKTKLMNFYGFSKKLSEISSIVYR